MTDAELLEAWSGGDLSAAETLISRHLDTVHRFFSGKVDSDLEDLVQRTFLRCIEKRDTYRGDGEFRAFLLGIARYELLDVYRRKANGRVFDPAVSSLEDLAPRPSELLRADQEKQALLHALRRIPLDQQLLLELYYWERMTGAEIAAVLGVPSPTVRGRLRRARKALAEAVESVAQDPEIARRTISSFESWAASVREPFEQH